MIGVWLASAIYSTPKFIFSRTITNVYTNGMNEEICIMHRKLFNSKVLDCVNFVALYVLPLLVMTVSVYLRYCAPCVFLFFRVSLPVVYSASKRREILRQMIIFGVSERAFDKIYIQRQPNGQSNYSRFFLQ